MYRIVYIIEELERSHQVLFESLFRSRHRRCSVRKGVLRNFAKFTGKHLCQSHFFKKVVGLRPATLLKRRLWHRCFPVIFANFLRTPFLQNTSGRLLLIIYISISFVSLSLDKSNLFLTEDSVYSKWLKDVTFDVSKGG